MGKRIYHRFLRSFLSNQYTMNGKHPAFEQRRGVVIGVVSLFTYTFLAMSSYKVPLQSAVKEKWGDHITISFITVGSSPTRGAKKDTTQMGGVFFGFVSARIQHRFMSSLVLQM